MSNKNYRVKEGNVFAATIASITFEVLAYTVCLMIFENSNLEDSFGAAVMIVVLVGIWRLYQKAK